ncbi:MAG: hypothetical protein GX139_08570 [Armatimonadetes bacterium]|nr:hypothetical protein [Armatimonadota bacterium]
MNTLVGIIIICACLVLAINYPVAFFLLLALVVIVWILKQANKQSDDSSIDDQTANQKHPIGTALSQALETNSRRVRVQPPKHQTPPAPHISNAEDPPASSEMRWVGTGSRMIVGPYQISDPLVYCSSEETILCEASCINFSLSIGARADELKGALGYWPEYSRMSPNQRTNYLHWLASGRTSPLNDIGYAFLFFYGLERRVLVDGADVRLVVTEVLRLLSRYSFSGSFNKYASNFIAYVAAKGGIDRLAKGWFDTFAEPFFRIGGEPMSFALAWLHVHQRPLPAKLAYLLASHDVRFANSVVVQRLTEQFEQLFATKYREAFGDGLLLQCAARPLVLHYKTATPSFKSSQHMTDVVVPNVMGLPSQFNKMVEIWTACIDELRPLSRKLAKGIDVNSREAYNALPESLRAEVEHPDKPRWDTVVNEHIVKDGLALVQVSDIAAIGDQVSQPRLTSKQSEELAETANHVGYVLVPDFRITGQAYKCDDTVGIFRPKGEPTLPADDSFIPATRVLKLGVAMAASDGMITGEEVEHITNFLETEFGLGPDDLRRLEVYREVLSVDPPSMRSVAAQLKAVLSKDQLLMLCHFLVGLAAADGGIPKDEIKVLRSTYAAFEVDEADLFALLNDISTSSDGSVEIATAAPTRPGEPIPPRAKAIDEPIITIDHNKVRWLINESKEVSRILGEAMQEIIPDNEPILSVSGPGITADLSEQTNAAVVADGHTSLVSSEILELLDQRYHKLLDLLLDSDEWTRDEFNSLVRQHGLMPSSTIEVINSWSDEHLGDFLIDESDSLSINRQIIGG